MSEVYQSSKKGRQIDKAVDYIEQTLPEDLKVIKEEFQSEIDVKADKATTLKGYGITDAFTKAETSEYVGANCVDFDSFQAYRQYAKEIFAEIDLSNVSNADFKAKADAAGVGGGSVDAYTKDESDSRFAQKADTYTKEETEQISVGFVNSYAEYAEGLFAHKAHNLIGYGITDAYTKDEVNSLVGDIETALDDKADMLEFATDLLNVHKIEDSGNYPFKALLLQGAVENPTIRVYGKNLIKPEFANYLNNVMVDGNEVNINNTTSGAIYPQINLSPQLPTEMYTLSLNVTSVSGQPLIYVQYPNHGYKTVLHINRGQGQYLITFTAPVQSIMITMQAGSTLTFSGFQLEIGAAATEFEPYKEPQSVAVPYTYADGDSLTLENGTVKNNISGIEEDITNTQTGQALLALHTNYPSTTIVCDVDCKLAYKADTTNAFRKLNNELDILKQAIINLGGTI